MAASMGGVIGSGWLFAGMYAARASGPAAILSWLIGGASILVIALIYAELSAARPEAGGTIRYPAYTNGTLAASLVSWSTWLLYTANPPTEASAAVQYLSYFWLGLYVDGALSGAGVAVAIGLMVLFVVVNYFGVRWFARLNNGITAIKVFVPLLTVLALIFTSFHPANFTGEESGGFAPYGISGALGAITTAGILFAYTGFEQAIALGEEGSSPVRDVPRAVLTVMGASIVIYVGLQVAFLGGVTPRMLSRGWDHVSLNSPFADLAVAANLTWLSWLLFADSVISPSGSSLSFTASSARLVYAMGENGFFPGIFRRLHPRFGVPHYALLLNFLVGLAFLLPLPSWQSLVSVMGVLVGFAYATGAVSITVFRHQGIVGGIRIPAMRLLAPAGFIISTLISYWAGWQRLHIAIPMLLAGAVVYAISCIHYPKPREDLRGGVWLVMLILSMLIVSYLGSFGGRGLLNAPWDSVVMGAISLLVYLLGTRSGFWYTSRPFWQKEILPQLQRDHRR